VHAFPSVIDGMARGCYPLEGWVETIPFESLVDRGLERLRRQEGLKILVEMKSAGAAD
jgi:(R,R)-butanediol dehydrogenase/meso-butanediol dehydrogenase/diacetyl reductase